MQTETEKLHAKAVKIAQDLYFQGESLRTIYWIGGELQKVSDKALDNVQNTIGSISNGAIIFE